MVAARRGVGRDVLVVALLLGAAAAGFWGFAWWTVSGGQPTREVRREIPEAALVGGIYCKSREWGSNLDPLIEGAGIMPAGFVPSTVIWCREDGRVQETPWTGAWSDQLSKPDVVWVLAHVFGGGCPAVAHEPLDLLVVDSDGAGYRPATPKYPCGERMQDFVERANWQ